MLLLLAKLSKQQTVQSQPWPLMNLGLSNFATTTKLEQPMEQRSLFGTEISLARRRRTLNSSRVMTQQLVVSSTTNLLKTLARTSTGLIPPTEATSRRSWVRTQPRETGTRRRRVYMHMMASSTLLPGISRPWSGRLQAKWAVERRITLWSAATRHRAMFWGNSKTTLCVP